MISFVKKYFVLWIILYIWLGYVLDNILYIKYIDEVYSMFALLLVAFFRCGREFRFLIGVFLFYIAYSWFFSANPVHKAQIIDFIQQIKPYSFFYLAYYFPPKMSAKTERFLRLNALAVAICFLVSALVWGFGRGKGLIWHPLVLGISAFCFSLTYFYWSPKTRKNVFITFCILSIGLLSLRSKFYGEYIGFIFLFFYVKKRLVLNIKYLAGISIAVVATLYVAHAKLTVYFVTADTAARYVLYANMPRVLKDFFPFGSGFASYATHVSGEYYSPLYYKYGLQHCFGMSENFYGFIADTYFPVLAEFGVVGIFLFILFWWKRYKDISTIAAYDINCYKIGMLILAMVIIESVAGPILVTNWIYLPMTILGSICARSREYVCNTKQTTRQV